MSDAAAAAALAVGAECLRSGGVHSAYGRSAPARHRGARGRRRRGGSRWRPRTAATSRSTCRRRPRARATASAWTTASALPRSGLALPARGPSRPVAGRRSRDASAGPTRGWAGRRCAGRSSTSCTSARSRRKARGRRRGRELGDLADLGVTCVEIMPVAEFPGRFGWGYDGVDLFAPTRLYGQPDDLRRFVDGPTRSGSASSSTSSTTTSARRATTCATFCHALLHRRGTRPIGARRSTSTAGSGPVREFFIANAGYWIDEFHLDGLRLDATQAISTLRDEHVLARHRARGARRGRAAARDAGHRRERAAGDTARAADRRRRLRPRRGVERRLPPHVPRGRLTGRATRPTTATTRARRRS